MKNNVLAHIHAVAPKVMASMEVCLSSTAVSKVNAALAEAKNQTTEALASVNEHPNKRNLSSTRKSLTAIENLLAGLQHGLETRELKVKDFRSVCSNLKTSFIPRLETSISEEVDKFKAEAGIDTEQEVELTPEQQAIRTAILQSESAEKSEDEVSEDEPEEESEFDREAKIAEREDQERRNQLAGITGDVERRLARLRSMISHLPRRMSTPYSIVKLPVAPHFETEAAKNPVLLDKLAIPHTEIPLYGNGSAVPVGLTKQKMERYVIFEQQTILLVSKSYVESLMTHKQNEQDDENSEEFKGFRQRRKQLKAAIEEAEADIEIARQKYSGTASQQEEIKRLTEKLTRFGNEVDAALKAQYTKEDREAVTAFKKARAEVLSIENQIDKMRERFINDGTMKREEYDKKVKELFEQADKADKVKNTTYAKLEKINRRYAKTAEVKKKIEQIGIMERKLDKARQLEHERERLVPDAESRLARHRSELEKMEEEVKNRRRTIKRSGPALTAEDYARSVLAVINERSTSKFALVTPKPAPNPRNSRDILCFWLMPTSKLSALMRQTGGKAKVTQWDFPFESDRHLKVENEQKGWVHLKDRDPESLTPQELREFLEYPQNAKYRPEGWKSIYKKARRLPE